MKTHDSKDIGGLRYTVSQLPTMRGWKLLNRIARIVLPSMAALAPAAVALKKGGGVKNLMDVNIEDLKGLDGAVLGIFERCTEEEQEHITRALLENAVVVVDGRQAPLFGPGGQFDVVLQGQMLAVAQLVKFAFEVNYGDFSGAFALIAKLGADLGVKAEPDATPAALKLTSKG